MCQVPQTLEATLAAMLATLGVASATPGIRLLHMFGNAPPRINFNEDVFKHFLLQWIVANDISFRMCEDSFFQRLCAYLAVHTPEMAASY